MAGLEMDAHSALEENLYLAVPTRTLYDACHRLGRDDNGRRCPTCTINDPSAKLRPRGLVGNLARTRTKHEVTSVGSTLDEPSGSRIVTGSWDESAASGTPP